MRHTAFRGGIARRGGCPRRGRWLRRRFSHRRSLTGSGGSVPLILTITEIVTRAAVLTLPCFFAIQWSRKSSILTMAAMAVALLVYHLAWARFFTGDSSVDVLSASFLGIPSPLALAPIVFLILASYLIDSWSMVSLAVVFGVSHVWVTALHR